MIMGWPTDSQRAFLQDFANRHGRNWKMHLLAIWRDNMEHAHPYSDKLKAVRKQVGPEMLHVSCMNIKPETQ